MRIRHRFVGVASPLSESSTLLQPQLARKTESVPRALFFSKRSEKILFKQIYSYLKGYNPEGVRIAGFGRMRIFNPIQQHRWECRLKCVGMIGFRLILYLPNCRIDENSRITKANHVCMRFEP